MNVAQPIPGPATDDDEDVRWALSTAGALYTRGETQEALKWLKRAAETASDANRDQRSLELFKAAADLKAALGALGDSLLPTEPAQRVPQHAAPAGGVPAGATPARATAIFGTPAPAAVSLAGERPSALPTIGVSPAARTLPGRRSQPPPMPIRSAGPSVGVNSNARVEPPPPAVGGRPLLSGRTLVSGESQTQGNKNRTLASLGSRGSDGARGSGHEEGLADAVRRAVAGIDAQHDLRGGAPAKPNEGMEEPTPTSGTARGARRNTRTGRKSGRSSLQKPSESDGRPRQVARPQLDVPKIINAEDDDEEAAPTQLISRSALEDAGVLPQGASSGARGVGAQRATERAGEEDAPRTPATARFEDELTSEHEQTPVSIVPAASDVSPAPLHAAAMPRPSFDDLDEQTNVLTGAEFETGSGVEMGSAAVSSAVADASLSTPHAPPVEPSRSSSPPSAPSPASLHLAAKGRQLVERAGSGSHVVGVVSYRVGVTQNPETGSVEVVALAPNEPAPAGMLTAILVPPDGSTAGQLAELLGSKRRPKRL